MVGFFLYSQRARLDGGASRMDFEGIFDTRSIPSLRASSASLTLYIERTPHPASALEGWDAGDTTTHERPDTHNIIYYHTTTMTMSIASITPGTLATNLHSTHQTGRPRIPLDALRESKRRDESAGRGGGPQ